MRAERLKWEARYQAGDRAHDGPPSALLVRWLSYLPRGRALDVATGLGRNALFLARAGYRVDAIDIAPTCLAEAARRARRRGLHVRWIEADLDHYRLPRACYDVVVNAFFLKRGLFPALRAAVRPGGVVIFETHLVSDATPSRVRTPAHRLRSGELARRFRGWEVLEYAEGVFTEGGQRVALGRIVARRPGGGGRPGLRGRPRRARGRRSR
ncbi:MAG: methyltransferase domain-containing protein [Armatimonadota bacterium]|nr:methyltransferase domain-containing protein [Armatimonadota bacterium]MDR7421700.1 methyltransferase domain-containing protein [Armatimonadota bacterium]MDR7455489.1 methyltransferase domain-containing protein [Armatimonadota bacterium]MDR7457860.1 methyltransferase domain-containing protein [Armatimonadota bacterium]MDR7495828.1 methyltransferase domain-containing protein [Armatimonadota bacterium]